MLERGEMGEEAAERLAARAEGVRAALSGREPHEIERFLAHMPRSYLLSVPPEQAATHVSLVEPALGRLEVRTHAGAGAGPGTYSLTVAAADRPGLLSLIAGALSLAGLSILSAQVFTTEDGTAVDVFEVEGVFESEIGERVEEKRKRYPASRVDVPVEVTVENDASDFFTVIEVGAPDRIGLLFDITRTLAELQLDVQLAKVATYGGRVVDAFYVRDVLGRKVDDPEHVEEVKRALIARLTP